MTLILNKAKAMRSFLGTLGGYLRSFGVPVVVVAGSAFGVWLSNQKISSARAAAPVVDEPRKEEKVCRQGADRIVVPENIAAKMGLKTAVVTRPTRPLALPTFPGNLALNSNELQRVHSRFAGEVVSLGSTTEPALPSTTKGPSKAEITRLLRVGDKVAKGQILAVIWSKELGEKKSELVDAASKMKLDVQVLDRLKNLYKQSGTSERAVLDAERTVESDRVALERAERTLRSWRLSEKEIKEIRSEADHLCEVDRGVGSTDDWAKVEIRAVREGVILEKNVCVGEIVDTTTDLFKIGDLSRLTVWAHVYEDDLHHLADLPKPIHWNISILSRPGLVCKGCLEQVGAVIDPNQHTALITGCVDNLNGDLKIGQFVTVSIERCHCDKDLVLPADAVIEDGRESVVYVQPKEGSHEYERRIVKVEKRTRQEIFLKESDSGLHAGDRVVTAGALLIHNAMESLPVPTAKAAQ
jgi:cobalt-zinc-cadmium efflux system membrane fusion protein